MKVTESILAQVNEILAYSSELGFQLILEQVNHISREDESEVLDIIIQDYNYGQPAPEEDITKFETIHNAIININPAIIEKVNNPMDTTRLIYNADLGLCIWATNKGDTLTIQMSDTRYYIRYFGSGMY